MQLPDTCLLPLYMPKAITMTPKENTVKEKYRIGILALTNIK